MKGRNRRFPIQRKVRLVVLATCTAALCVASLAPFVLQFYFRQKDGTTAALAVLDNGIGIAPENLKSIFSHGFTTRRRGHGFGLHSAALTAQQMGGRLIAQSEGPGHGATFILELPLAAPAAI